MSHDPEHLLNVTELTTGCFVPPHEEVCSRPSPLACKDAGQRNQFGSPAAPNASATGRIMALASSAVLRLRQACKAISTCLRGDFPEPLAPIGMKSGYISLLPTIPAPPSLRLVTGTRAGIATGGQVCPSCPGRKTRYRRPGMPGAGKQLFWRGETATTLKFANIRLAQIALGPEADPRPVQQGPSRRHLLWR